MEVNLTREIRRSSGTVKKCALPKGTASSMSSTNEHFSGDFKVFSIPEIISKFPVMVANMIDPPFFEKLHEFIGVSVRYTFFSDRGQGFCQITV